MYISYITLSRLIVLYSHCRVNRDTNLFVVCVLCNILILASTVRIWAPCVAFPTYGAHPHHAAVCSVPFGFKACDLAYLQTPLDFALSEPLPGGLQCWLQAVSDIGTCSYLQSCEACKRVAALMTKGIAANGRWAKVQERGKTNTGQQK